MYKRQLWKRYLDAEFPRAKDCGLDTSRDSVKKLVEEELIKPAEEINDVSPDMKLTDRHSAVLFGPPGTAKTSLCKAVAKRLGWYFVELSPSDFLGSGLDGIYNKVEEVFADLMDLYGVVILFDEMDALVQNREARPSLRTATDAQDEDSPGTDTDDGTDTSITEDRVREIVNNETARVTPAHESKLDVTETLLTTSMLPKLAKLHGDRRTMYFMATNFIGSFDGAIIRAGRFDMHIHMGPPSLEAKIDGLPAWCGKDDPNDIEAAQKRLGEAVEADDPKDQFGRFTYAETRRFFEALKMANGEPNIAKAIAATNVETLREQLADWAGSKITLKDGSVALDSYLDEQTRSCLQ